jgi:hypothetical protein
MLQYTKGHNPAKTALSMGHFGEVGLIGHVRISEGPRGETSLVYSTEESSAEEIGQKKGS